MDRLQAVRLTDRVTDSEIYIQAVRQKSKLIDRQWDMQVMLQIHLILVKKTGLGCVVYIITSKRLSPEEVNIGSSQLFAHVCALSSHYIRMSVDVTMHA